MLTDLDEEKLLKQSSELKTHYSESNVLAYYMDVSSEESICNTYQMLLQDSIHISILINNAAIDPKVNKEYSLGERTRLENYDIDQWDKELQVGLRGAFLCSKVFGTAMAASDKAGVILNIASDLSVISPDQRLYREDGVAKELQPVKPITYSVIKAGLVGMTRYLSTYWAEEQVRCNSLSPGGVENGQSDDFIKKVTALVPMGRMASIDEYSSAIQFLCSDASSYLNGQNIVMDGGRSTW